MTLRDLSVLFRRYVPIESRHSNAWPTDGAGWWPAHEIGHLLTVPRENMGLPMFGLDDDVDPEAKNEFERRCYELAAMYVSRKLLIASGREDLADQELEDTDADTVEMSWDKDAIARRNAILREHHIVYVPCTVVGLERRLAAIAPKKISPHDEMMAMGWKRAAYISRERQRYAVADDA